MSQLANNPRFLAFIDRESTEFSAYYRTHPELQEHFQTLFDWFEEESGVEKFERNREKLFNSLNLLEEILDFTSDIKSAVRDIESKVRQSKHQLEKVLL